MPRQQGPPGFQPSIPQDRLSSLESKMDKLLDTIGSKFSSQEEKFDRITKNHSSSIHNLEVQMGQLANALATRNFGSLPSNTESNPRDQVKAITIRSGKEVGFFPTTNEGKKQEEEEQQEKDNAQKKEASKGEVQLPPYVPKVPFPQRLKKHQLDAQFSKFVEKLRKLQINLSFVEALENMPKYAKFLKDILSNKRAWDDNQTVSLTESCSSIISSKVPLKLQDPGSFTIPCVVGNLEFDNCLCDLGASINLMPLSIFKKLGLGEVKPSSMVLQLADQSFKRPYGKVEDVLVKVDKFIIPVDFVVLDYEEDKNCPLIFGRPFLNTVRALVDVNEGKLTLRIGDEQVEFCMRKSMKNPMERELCMRIDVVEECVFEEEEKKQEAIFVSIGEQEMVKENPTSELLMRVDAPTLQSILKPQKMELKPLHELLDAG